MNYRTRERLILTLAILAAFAFLGGSIWYAKLILAV